MSSPAGKYAHTLDCAEAEQCCCKRAATRLQQAERRVRVELRVLFLLPAAKAPVSSALGWIESATQCKATSHLQAGGKASPPILFQTVGGAVKSKRKKRELSAPPNTHVVLALSLVSFLFCQAQKPGIALCNSTHSFLCCVPPQ